MPREVNGVWVSDDGKWTWDGSAWKPARATATAGQRGPWKLALRPPRPSCCRLGLRSHGCIWLAHRRHRPGPHRSCIPQRACTVLASLEAISFSRFGRLARLVRREAGGSARAADARGKSRTSTGPTTPPRSRDHFTPNRLNLLGNSLKPTTTATRTCARLAACDPHSCGWEWSMGCYGVLGWPSSRSPLASSA